MLFSQRSKIKNFVQKLNLLNSKVYQTTKLIKGIDQKQTTLRLLNECITPMNSYRLINTLWPEFAELLATRPITLNLNGLFE